MWYSYSVPTCSFKLSKVQLESREKWMKESSLVNWNNLIYLDQAAFYKRDVTHKNRKP